jgi:methyl-accepting chemotaxis protein
MNTMLISPMQHDFINRGEFDKFKEHIDDRFDEQKEYTLDGFKAMDRKIDFVYGELSGELKVIKEVQADHTKKLDRIDTSITHIQTNLNQLNTSFSQINASLTLLTKLTTKVADKIL